MVEGLKIRRLIVGNLKVAEVEGRNLMFNISTNNVQYSILNAGYLIVNVFCGGSWKY
jgi:hypothetical protein